MESHAEDLRSEVEEERRGEWIDAIKASWRSVSLSGREHAICSYTDKLTRTPGSMLEDDLVPLREAGLEDRGIVDLVHVVGFFSYANRIADGLGVDLEDSMSG